MTAGPTYALEWCLDPLGKEKIYGYRATFFELRSQQSKYRPPHLAAGFSGPKLH